MGKLSVVDVNGMRNKRNKKLLTKNCKDSATNS